MCLIGCLALFFPRLAFLLTWFLLPGYLEKVLHPWYLLVLGFLFLPLTALALAFATLSLGPQGEVSPLGWVLVVLAGLADLGLIGSGARAKKKR